MSYRLYLIFIIFALVLIVVGCGKTENDSTTKEDSTTNGKADIKNGATKDKTPTKTNNKTTPEPPKEKKYNLDLNWELGRERTHISKSELRISTKIGGKEISEIYIKERNLWEKITKIDGEVAKITWAYKHFKNTNITSDNKTFVVDTNDVTKTSEDSKQIYELLCNIIDKKFIINLSNKSKILKVEGIDEFIYKILHGYLGQDWKINPNRKPLETQLRAAYNEKELIDTFSEGYFNLPATGITLADEWKDEIVIEYPYAGKVAFRITHKLRDVKKVNNESIAVVEMIGVYAENSRKNEIAKGYTITSASYKGSFEFNITMGEFGKYERNADINTLFYNESGISSRINFSQHKIEKVEVAE